VKQTILLVDDEPLVREELGGFLEDEGYRVLRAADGEEGLDAFRAYRPDMVITDARMPRREGLDLARAILEEVPNVPITMITGHGSEAMAISALRLGISDFIKKPVQIADLLAALDRMESAARSAKERIDLGGALPAGVRLVRHTTQYVLGNDVAEIPSFVKVLVSEVAADIDARRRDGLQLALREILLNAVEHGNLEVSYEEKTQATEAGTLDRLLSERRRDPRLADRKVTVDATRTPREIEVQISDEGSGFDWRGIPDPTDPANLLLGHGRGVLLAHLSVDRLSFSETGNRVTLFLNAGSQLRSSG
jgi:DNA-binding response OmpR family regulator